MTVSLVVISCSGEGDPGVTYDSQRILECHNEQTWGIDATRNRIVGLWQWKHVEYVYGIPTGKNDELKGMKIEFRNDLTGTLTKDKAVPVEFTWSIGTYGVYFGFSTTPEIPQLNGQILFCDNVMLCGVAGSGIVDGVNNYFYKIR